MKYACGIDMGARKSQLCIIDGEHSILVEKNVPNDLATVVELLEPYREDIEIVVESTFNWYWLVDGLQDAGFKVHLAHTLGLYMITKAKVKTDRRDAFTLARLLMSGMIPEAHIYPKETRPTRDLLRRRLWVVRLRSAEYTSVQQLLLREGLVEQAGQEVPGILEEDLEEWLKHRFVLLNAKQELERIRLYTSQIRKLEKEIFQVTQDRSDYQALEEVPGLGKVLGMTVLYEVGDIARFRDAREFSSYCRLVPGTADSSGSSRRGRGSHQGNAYLKWAFGLAAVSAVRYYPTIRKCFERHLRRHRGRARKFIAYGVIAHKLALVVYHILRHKVHYQEELLFGK